jgi:hypothetical protein
MRKIRTAREAGIDVSDAEVDTQYAAIAARMHETAEQMTARFINAGVDPATLKRGIRAEIAAARTLRHLESRPADPPASHA